MPIGGIVITCNVELKDQVLKDLEAYADLEIHGADDQGNIVAVIDSDSSEDMEKLIDTINKHDQILNVGMTYLNTEDEAEKMARGEKLAKPFGFRKPLKQPSPDEQQ